MRSWAPSYRVSQTHRGGAGPPGWEGAWSFPGEREAHCWRPPRPVTTRRPPNTLQPAHRLPLLGRLSKVLIWGRGHQGHFVPLCLGCSGLENGLGGGLEARGPAGGLLMIPGQVVMGPGPRGVAFGVGRRRYGGIWEELGGCVSQDSNLKMLDMPLKSASITKGRCVAPICGNF